MDPLGLRALLPVEDREGEIGIWRVCIFNEEQNTSARLIIGDEYKYDVTIDYV